MIIMLAAFIAALSLAIATSAWFWLFRGRRGMGSRNQTPVGVDRIVVRNHAWDAAVARSRDLR